LSSGYNVHGVVPNDMGLDLQGFGNL